MKIRSKRSEVVREDFDEFLALYILYLGVSASGFAF